MPDTNRDEVEKIANDEITSRFQRIGIWEQTPEDVEATRANNRLVNELRIAREKQKGAIKRSITEMVTSAMGQGLWVAVFALAVFVGHFFLQWFAK